MCGVFKRNGIPRERVRHNTNREGKSIADKAHEHDGEQAENNSAGVAPQIRHQAAQALVERSFAGLIIYG